MDSNITAGLSNYIFTTAPIRIYWLYAVLSKSCTYSQLDRQQGFESQLPYPSTSSERLQLSIFHWKSGLGFVHGESCKCQQWYFEGWMIDDRYSDCNMMLDVWLQPRIRYAARKWTNKWNYLQTHCIPMQLSLSWIVAYAWNNVFEHHLLKMRIPRSGRSAWNYSPSRSKNWLEDPLSAPIEASGLLFGGVHSHTAAETLQISTCTEEPSSLDRTWNEFPTSMKKHNCNYWLDSEEWWRTIDQLVTASNTRLHVIDA